MECCRAKSTPSNAGPWMIYGAPRSNIIARAVTLRSYLITGCNFDLFCGRGRLDMSSRMSDQYLHYALYFSTCGAIFAWVACLHSFLHPRGDFAMILSSRADISFVIAVLGGGSVLSPNFALQCSGIATLALPLARTALLDAENDFRSKLLLHPSP